MMNKLTAVIDAPPARTGEQIRRELEVRAARLQTQKVEPEIALSVALREAVANQVFEAMRAQNITQAELAQRLSKNRAQVCRILGGGANLTLDSLAALGAALDCEIQVRLVDNRRAASTCSEATTASNGQMRQPNFSGAKPKTAKSCATR